MLACSFFFIVLLLLILFQSRNCRGWTHDLFIGQPCLLRYFLSLSLSLSFNTRAQCTISITTFINKVFEHSDSLLTITCTTWMCYIFCLLCHIWSMKMIVTSQSQSLLLCKITPNTIIGFILMYSLCYQIILTLSMGGWSNTVPPSLSI